MAVNLKVMSFQAKESAKNERAQACAWKWISDNCGPKRARTNLLKPLV